MPTNLFFAGAPRTQKINVEAGRQAEGEASQSACHVGVTSDALNGKNVETRGAV